MFNRPRCRDWIPLATQQLRLRSLIRITGHNIVCRPKCQLYFTLHSTAMSAPFFTSEKVDPHSTFQWAEITSNKVLKSAARSVCIRVWEHYSDLESYSDENKSSKETISCTSNDKMLFIWGVHFSGLVPLIKRSDVRFYPNSLAFQMHGGFFASADTFTAETVRQQLATNYEFEQTEDSSNVCSSRIDIISDIKRTGDSCIDDNLTGTSDSKISSIEFEINSPHGSRSRSPTRLDSYNKSPCINLTKDMLNMLKVRYIERDFLDSEIRFSYRLESLLKLQEKQRKYKQKNEHAKEISEKICMKSAFCLNLELISSRGSLYQKKGNPSMGRTLNRLLFQDMHSKPEDILKAQEFRRQIELARFRCQLLSQEKGRAISDFRKLERKLGGLHDHTIEQESWLMSCYRTLSREKESLVQEKVISSEKRDLVLRIERQLKQRRTMLCKELQNIYPICRMSTGQFAINNVILPNSDNLIRDSKINISDYAKDSVSPLSLSVALGYAAHVVYMCSVIYNIPLRNPIKHEGSRSRILDIVKDMPHSSREFPLYCRTSPIPKAVCYAIYLLNQNVAQLNFQIHSIKCDLRETLLNLLRLMSGITPSIPEIMDMVIKNQNLSISSVDLHVPVPSVSKSMDIINSKVGEERLSRSMGSYSDEHISPERNVYSSEPILSVQNKIQLSEFNENCNI